MIGGTGGGFTQWVDGSSASGVHSRFVPVSSWVGTQLYYVSGSSRPTDGATQA